MVARVQSALLESESERLLSKKENTKGQFDVSG